MNIKPLHDRVVIRRVEEQQETAGGIILPGSAQEKQNTGEVVAVGPGKVSDAGTLVDMAVSVGDKVMFSAYRAEEVKDDKGETLLVLREEEIIAIID
ncbi:MAG: co-chaperone GroES [Pseudomonadota bacterium]|nr:co-chaperone GroES [Pseudomonadota bacterium]MEA3406046.1 co-chaperone GroES [Pseudomonadota bacterium]